MAALPVGEDARLIGMITDRDIVIRGLGAGRDPTRTSVREVMSTKLSYCFEDEDVEHAAQNMSQRQVRRLPVLDRSKRLVGMLSLSDIGRHAGIHVCGSALRGISQPVSETLPPGQEPQGIQKGIADADKLARTGSTNETVRDTPPAGAWNDTSAD